MYGLKEEIDLSFLNGREVIQIAMGVYQTQLGFDEDVTISVGGEFTYFGGQGDSIWKPEPGFSPVAARTVALLGASIQFFESNENGALKLSFSNSQRLTIPDSSKKHESCQITRPGHTIVA